MALYKRNEFLSLPVLNLDLYQIDPQKEVNNYQSTLGQLFLDRQQTALLSEQSGFTAAPSISAV